MENEVAVMSMIVGKQGDVEGLNALLHAYGDVIIGRMGIPYRKRGVNIISVVLDAPRDKIAALEEKIAALPDVSAKTAWAGA